MKEYTVHWCDIHNTYGGQLSVYAQNEHDAVVKSRKILQMGCNFHLVGVERRNNND